MTLAEKIKLTRENKKMTQKEVAGLMGISQQAYGQYETGSRTPKPDTLKKIADALGCRPYELYPDDLADDAIRFFMLRGLNPTLPESDPELIEMYGRIQRKLDAEEAQNALSQEKIWPEGSTRLESSAKEYARHLFYELPDDWHKDTAISWQIEILRQKMGKNCNNAMFEALMQLYQDEETFTQELAKRIETLVYGTSAGPDDKEPTEK